jgi:outer membrane receptor for ferrienterochelin and colicins
MFIFRLIRIILAISMSLVYYQGITQAQAQRNLDVDLEKVVVTPSRYPQFYGKVGRSVYLIDQERLQVEQPQDISEVLDDLPSVIMIDYGALGANKSVRMRGSSAEQVLIMVDGRPVTSPRDGTLELSTMPTGIIERIEVVPGPASSIYGSSAVGGVINIITKEPKVAPQASLITKFGTFRTWAEEFIYTGKAGELGYFFTVDSSQSQGHRDNSEFYAKNINSKLEYQLNPENKLRLFVGAHTSKLGTPGEITGPFLDLDDQQEWDKNYIDLAWELNSDERINLTLRAYQNFDRLEFIETFEPLDKNTHQTKQRAIELQCELNPLEDLKLIWGLSGQDNLNNSSTTGKHRYIVRAAFLEGDLTLWDKLNIIAGARLDDYSNFGSELSPSINFAYNLRDDVKLKALLARSFRAPTFNDLYWPFDGWTEGNPNLKPEKGISGEVGADARIFDKALLKIAYFHQDMDNLINWAPGSDGVWRPSNVNSSLSQGVEFVIQFPVFEWLKSEINYTYLRAKDDKADKYLIYRPKHKVVGNLECKAPWGINLNLQAQYTTKRFHNTSNTIHIDDYFVMGLFLSKEFNNNCEVFLKFNNLLNRKYSRVRNYPLPGFSLVAGTKVTF